MRPFLVSLCLCVFVSHSVLLPITKSHRVAGSRFGAVAGNVIDLVEPAALGRHGRNHGYPVLDFRRSGAEKRFGEPGQGIFVAPLHGMKNRLVEFLINHEVREPSGSHQRDTRMAFPAFDGPAQRMA